MRKFLCILLLFLNCFAYSSTVRLINDSPFPLTATILSATGAVCGRYSLQPQEQAGWETFDIDSKGVSQTPYTVIFYCQTGEVYGTATGISTGGMVYSTSTSGPRFCKPKDDKKGKEEQEKSDLQYQPHPINPDQWRKQSRF